LAADSSYVKPFAPLGIAPGKPLNLARVFMSQHPSLRAASATATKRNVLKRFERVELLKKRGQWKTGDRVVGLRKTKPEN
jgi:small basic protein (TIGR04137 family)